MSQAIAFAVLWRVTVNVVMYRAPSHEQRNRTCRPTAGSSKKCTLCLQVRQVIALGVQRRVAVNVVMRRLCESFETSHEGHKRVNVRYTDTAG